MFLQLMFFMIYFNRFDGIRRQRRTSTRTTPRSPTSNLFSIVETIFAERPKCSKFTMSSFKNSLLKREMIWYEERNLIRDYYQKVFSEIINDSFCLKGLVLIPDICLNMMLNISVDQNAIYYF
jgi:hypothetical protein